MTRILFTIILALTVGYPPVYAKTLMVPTDEVTTSEFEAALKNLPERISYQEYYLSETPKLRNIELLNQYFAQAQASFISLEDKALIRTKLENVLKLEFEEDWKKPQRRILLMSYLRLIQLTLDDPEQTEARISWIKQALFYLQEIDPPTDLIPPPVFQEVEKIKSQLPLIEVQIASKDFDQVLIQGQPYNPQSPILVRVPSRSVRVTYLSNRYKPSSQVLSIADLGKFQPQKISWVKGECDKAILLEGPTSMQIYKGLNCKTEVVETTPSKEIQLPVLSTSKTSFKPSMNKWVWVAAGVVVSALLINELNKNKTSSSGSPSNTYGF